MEMDIGTFRGVLTVVLMALFIGLVFWAYSRRRHDDFERMARLPLDDDFEAAVRSVDDDRHAASGRRTSGMERD